MNTRVSTLDLEVNIIRELREQDINYTRGSHLGPNVFKLNNI